MVVTGGFGIGKTALLDAFTAEARGRGFAVRIAKSARLESHLPGAVVRQLAPCLANEHDLEELYARAASSARKGPILMVIDDVHVADTFSKRALAYLRPRLQGLPVVMALGASQGYLSTDEVTLPEIAGSPPAPHRPRRPRRRDDRPPHRPRPGALPRAHRRQPVSATSVAT